MRLHLSSYRRSHRRLALDIAQQQRQRAREQRARLIRGLKRDLLLKRAAAEHWHARNGELRALLDRIRLGWRRLDHCHQSQQSHQSDRHRQETAREDVDALVAEWARNETALMVDVQVWADAALLQQQQQQEASQSDTTSTVDRDEEMRAHVRRLKAGSRDVTATAMNTSTVDDHQPMSYAYTDRDLLLAVAALTRQLAGRMDAIPVPYALILIAIYILVLF